MNRTWFKKPLTVAVLLLFISVSVIPSTGTTDVKQIAIPASSGDTLYVGGSGLGNYTSIQDAIDNASVGDTVFVYDDSSPYFENVVVNKSINIAGEDRNTTIIDGNNSGDVVYISAEDVVLSGFRIQNSGNNWGDAGIDIRSNFNHVSGNHILKNKIGIYLNSSSNNTITGNDISDNGVGIRLDYSSNNRITGNCISENYSDGINLFDSSNNKITGNCIWSNSDGICLVWDSSSNTINGNNIISNNNNGVHLLDGNFNNISNNVICFNLYNIDLSSSNENTINNNTISNGYQRGILLRWSNDNIISRNHISSTKYYGMQIESGRNKIIENNFINNTKHVSFTVFTSIGWGFGINRWDSNYWDNWIGLEHPQLSKLPKRITGIFTRMIRIPIFVFAFDWHPAREPYDIGV